MQRGHRWAKRESAYCMMLSLSLNKPASSQQALPTATATWLCVCDANCDNSAFRIISLCDTRTFAFALLFYCQILLIIMRRDLRGSLWQSTAKIIRRIDEPKTKKSVLPQQLAMLDSIDWFVIRSIQPIRALLHNQAQHGGGEWHYRL